MNTNKFAAIAVLVAVLGCASQSSYRARAEQSSPAGEADAQPFLGRWDLTLKAADREYPSWLEIREEDGQLKAQMVGRWGSARPLPKVEIANSHVSFVSPKEEEGSNSDLIFQGQLTGRTLSGTLNGPDGKTWQWTGVRAPMLDKTSEPKWGKSIRLFNGKDLSGWRMDRPGPPEWTVQNGTLVSPGNGPELTSDAKFQDFKLHVEFNCGKDSNSGIYLRGRYEVQVETDSQTESPSHHTGGVYGFLASSPEQPRTPDKWQTFDMTLIGRRITIVQNGKTVIAGEEIPGITGGAVDSNESSPGPIYLQGSEKGHVAYRNLVITPAK